MAIAHIRNGSIIKRFSSESGWMTLEDGRQVSPPVVGFVDGNDKVVPVVEQTDDQSTGPDVVTAFSETVEPDRVLRLRTVRDMTSQEIDAQKSASFDNMNALQNAAIVDLYRLVKVLADNANIQLNPLLNAANNSDLTLTQIKNRVVSKL